MKRKRYAEEQIISILKEHEAGASVSSLSRRHNVAKSTIYRWNSKFGGMEVSEAKYLREFERMKQKLKALSTRDRTKRGDKYELEPIFDLCSDESSVLLYSGQSEIRIRGEKYEGSVEARLDLLPQATIQLHGRFPGDIVEGNVSSLFDDIESFSIDGCEVEGFCIHLKPNIQETGRLVWDIVWCPESVSVKRVINDSSKAIRVVFHLMNFIDFKGEQRNKLVEMAGGGWSSGHISHVDLIYEGWKTELESLLSTRDSMGRLRQEGGHRLTHIGGIQRVDGTPFTIEEITKYLDLLGYFLSFVKGGWCAPVCPVGFDAHCERIWEIWSSPTERWVSPPISWFNGSGGSEMSTLFHGFMEYCSVGDRYEEFTEVIYWYLLANSSSLGADTGIILTQAAIEKLAYQYTVKEKKLISPRGFRGISASDKFRLLLSSLGIPLDVPATTPHLKKLVSLSKPKWEDGPHAFTEIRNSIIHAERKSQIQGMGIYDAWNLGLWYLEMSILAVCGYSGPSNNRLKSNVR